MTYELEYMPSHVDESEKTIHIHKIPRGMRDLKELLKAQISLYMSDNIYQGMRVTSLNSHLFYLQSLE